MANRVLIHPNGMKISYPGVNVLTAGPEGLLFDSDFGGLTVGARGQYYVGGFTEAHIVLPHWFRISALVLIEGGGFVAGGCRAGGIMKPYNFGFGGDASWWDARLIAGNVLRFRHQNWATAGTGLDQGVPAGPGFPYILNYAVLDT